LHVAVWGSNTACDPPPDARVRITHLTLPDATNPESQRAAVVDPTGRFSPTPGERPSMPIAPKIGLLVARSKTLASRTAP
jgi:hypothetical protein